MADYLYLVQIEVPADVEDEFNRLYDDEHVPLLLSVPGVHSAQRYKLEHAEDPATPRYLVLYEVDSADVPKTEAWLSKSNSGEWKDKIRPRCTTRRHAMFRRIT